MKRRKLTTVVSALIVGVALTFGTSSAALATSAKPERLDKTYKNYKPFPEECNPNYLSTGTCIILY
jgi:hypothetical protein